MKVLLTSTSFQDTPGKHQEALEETGWNIIKKRGPLKEQELLEIIEEIDAVICGDDEYTRAVITKGAESKLKCISKYGVGLDSIDLKAAKELKIPITNCPGINQNAVAEHVFGLLLTFFRNIHLQYQDTQNNKWNRLIGSEISDKKLGVFGFGSVGKAVALKAKSWGIDVYVVDKYTDFDFAAKNNITVMNSLEDLVSKVDILSLHAPLTKTTEGIISKKLLLNNANKGLTIINTARGKLVNNEAIIYALKSGILRGYLADVLEEEPIIRNHPFIGVENIIITPHIGSRTYESVEKQGKKAIENTKKILNNL